MPLASVLRTNKETLGITFSLQSNMAKPWRFFNALSLALNVDTDAHISQLKCREKVGVFKGTFLWKNLHPSL